MTKTFFSYHDQELPLNHYLGLRITKPMLTYLKQEAALNKTDVSRVLRTLIREGAKSRGSSSLM